MGEIKRAGAGEKKDTDYPVFSLFSLSFSRRFSAQGASVEER